MKKQQIGIRREDLDKRGEQRVALSPERVAQLVELGHTVYVQPGMHPDGVKKRAFSDQAYVEAGAIISEDLAAADLIFGLKEVKIPHLLPNKTYLFFSHTHKGQVKNRPALKTMMERNISLIDYELIVNAEEQRILTSFTYFAGYAGMTDSLWTLGKRWADRGIENPFSAMPQSIELGDLDKVKDVYRAIGKEIEEKGTPSSQPPLITAILGKGKTSKGSQEMYDLLPIQEISLEELPEVYANGSRNKVYKLVLPVADMFRFKPGKRHLGAGLTDEQIYPLYRKEPEHFESNLDQVFPYTTVLMNCIAWSPKYPRLLSRDDAQTWYSAHKTLEVIGDITCDPEGSIQFSAETWIDEPVFIYNPISREATLGFGGEGIAVMAVTNLPCEFSMDASTRFSNELSPLLKALAASDLDADSPALAGFPPQLAGATILWKGKLTPEYAYMQEYVEGLNA